MSFPLVWTIAASDSSGGAGIQADLATFYHHGVLGASIITAVTAQSAQHLATLKAMPAKMVAEQLRVVATDRPCHAIKIGVVATAANVSVIAQFLCTYSGFVVWDPVLATGEEGVSLLADDALVRLKELFPHLDLITPNRMEAEKLLAQPLNTAHAIENAANKFLQWGAKAILLKGGHSDVLTGYKCDFYCDHHTAVWLVSGEVDSLSVHGTGCVLSAAIAAAVAQGQSVLDAVVIGKRYVRQGMRLAAKQSSRYFVHDATSMLHEDMPLTMTALKKPFSIQLPRCDTSTLGLYPVVHSADWIERLLPLGVRTIQLRIKDRPRAWVEKQIERAVALAKHYRARLFINDEWKLAIRFGAYGVHLGQDDLLTAHWEDIAHAGLRVGISTHSWSEISRALTVHPSYIALGAIYPTTSKTMPSHPIGTKQLTTWVQLLGDTYPLVAIGGIHSGNIVDVLHSGVKGVAVISAITQARAPENTTQELMCLIDEAVTSSPLDPSF